MMFTRLARRVSMLAVLGLVPVAFAAGETRNQSEKEKEAITLINQLEDVARDVHYSAESLHSFIGAAQVSRWTHYHHLEQIKALVNEELRPALTELSELRPELPAWQQSNIDKMLTASNALAADTNSAIFTMKDAEPAPPALNAEYKALVATIYEHSEALVKTSDAASDFAEAHQKAVEADLEVPRQ
jgi:hypothetical protein